MARLDSIRQFVGRLRKAEKDKSTRDLRIVVDPSNRILVESDGKAYLIFLSDSSDPITPGRVKERIAKWPRFQKRPIAGYLILSWYADLSPRLALDEVIDVPQKVAVVGAWSRKNRVAASRLDSQMIELLKIAGVPQREIDKFSPGQQTATTVSKQNPNTLPPVSSPVVSVPVWIRSLKRGMKLDVYALETRLGRGHSAEVWKANVTKSISGVDLSPGMTVAIKVYSASLLQGVQPLRIQREFNVAADLVHENLARVYDLVLSPSRPFHTFMVMEYVEGPSLKDLIHQTGVLGSEKVLIIALQLFSALAELHSVGAVHRDVKAANIMLTAHDQPVPVIKLVDLGIVSLETDDRFTAASMFLGSKHSAPLEQLTGGELDERTDIYGAGTVLYHCLQGRAMYQDIGPEGAIVKTMLSQPERLTLDAGRQTPNELRFYEFINTCISVDPKDRPRTALECVTAINELMDAFAPFRT